VPQTGPTKAARMVDPKAVQMAYPLEDQLAVKSVREWVQQSAEGSDAELA
jgi:hypothetical protein